jgi:DNA sulfur modification protein DndD
MKITEIELRNYKPFYGTVTAYPTTESKSPILLMQGKNDAGKTSFHSAFRFCLYGPEDPDERHNLINRTAAIEGDGVAGVSISFEHGDEIFTVERMVEFSEVDEADDRQADNIYRVVRNANGDTVISQSDGTREYQMFINRVLPENVADFFFFDAEELNRFEESHDEDVREAIETVLGIQEIENAISDLDKKKDDYEREFSKIQSTIEANQERKERLQEINDRLDEIEGDGGELESVREQIETTRGTLEDVRQKLADLDETAEKRERVTEINDELDEIDSKLSEKADDRDEVRKEAGPMVAQNAAEVILHDYDVEGVSGEADVINSLLTGNRSECICGEPLTREHREHLRNRWSRLQSEETRALSEMQEICSKLDINVDANLQKYQNTAQEIRRLETRCAELSEEKGELKEDIREIEEGAEERLTQRRDEFKSKIKDFESKKEQLNREVGRLEDEKNKLMTRINSQGGATNREKRFHSLIGLAERSRDAMKDIKEDLIKRRREEVEQHASETFLELTNRPDHYEGLSITDNYELRIRSSGAKRTIQEQAPSEGQKQIIAYSFIAGLSKYTTREAPVVIDTPIGRLDREHKNNLLTYYPKLSDQVLILYQPNEMTLDDIEQLSDTMSTHFRIEVRDDVDDASRIVELPDLVIDPALEAD